MNTGKWADSDYGKRFKYLKCYKQLDKINITIRDNHLGFLVGIDFAANDSIIVVAKKVKASRVLS